MAEQPTQREYWSGKVGDAWAANATQMDATLAPLTEAALALAVFKPGERVLDIGCGAGATTLDIARRIGPNGAAIGVDISPPLLSLARARASATPQASFLEADAATATFEQKFDAVFSRFGVMFFEDRVAAFANIRATLRSDGRLTFVCWRPLAENAWAVAPIEAVRPMLTAPLPSPDPNAPGPYAFADPQRVESVLRDSGWRDITIAPWDGPIPIAGGGSLADIADFLMTIGPCARAIADQHLDAAAAKQRIIDALAPLHDGQGVSMPAACWLVTARA